MQYFKTPSPRNLRILVETPLDIITINALCLENVDTYDFFQFLPRIQVPWGGDSEFHNSSSPLSTVTDATYQNASDQIGLVVSEKFKMFIRDV